MITTFQRNFPMTRVLRNAPSRRKLAMLITLVAALASQQTFWPHSHCQLQWRPAECADEHGSPDAAGGARREPICPAGAECRCNLDDCVGRRNARCSFDPDGLKWTRLGYLHNGANSWGSGHPGPRQRCSSDHVQHHDHLAARRTHFLSAANGASGFAFASPITRPIVRLRSRPSFS